MSVFLKIVMIYKAFLEEDTQKWRIDVGRINERTYRIKLSYVGLFGEIFEASKEICDI